MLTIHQTSVPKKWDPESHIDAIQIKVSINQPVFHTVVLLLAYEQPILERASVLTLQAEQRESERASLRGKTAEEIMEQLTEEAMAEMIEEDEQKFQMTLSETPKKAQGVKISAQIKLENERKLADLLPEWRRLTELQRSQTRRIYAQSLEMVHSEKDMKSFITVSFQLLVHIVSGSNADSQFLEEYRGPIIDLLMKRAKLRGIVAMYR